MKQDEKEVVGGIACWIVVGVLMPIISPVISGILWWGGVALIAHGASLTSFKR